MIFSVLMILTVAKHCIAAPAETCSEQHPCIHYNVTYLSATSCQVSFWWDQSDPECQKNGTDTISHGCDSPDESDKEEDIDAGYLFITDVTCGEEAAFGLKDGEGCGDSTSSKIENGFEAECSSDPLCGGGNQASCQWRIKTEEVSTTTSIPTIPSLAPTPKPTTSEPTSEPTLEPTTTTSTPTTTTTAITTTSPPCGESIVDTLEPGSTRTYEFEFGGDDVTTATVSTCYTNTEFMNMLTAYDENGDEVDSTVRACIDAAGYIVEYSQSQIQQISYIEMTRVGTTGTSYKLTVECEIEGDEAANNLGAGNDVNSQSGFNANSMFSAGSMKSGVTYLILGGAALLIIGLAVTAFIVYRRHKAKDAFNKIPEQMGNDIELNDVYKNPETLTVNH